MSNGFRCVFAVEWVMVLSGRAFCVVSFIVFSVFSRRWRKQKRFQCLLAATLDKECAMYYKVRICVLPCCERAPIQYVCMRWEEIVYFSLCTSSAVQNGKTKITINFSSFITFAPSFFDEAHYPRARSPLCYCWALTFCMRTVIWYIYYSLFVRPRCFFIESDTLMK